MLFLISMRKTESPCEKKFFVTFRTCEKIEVKRGHLVKKWEFGQTKEISLYNFFKTRICAYMTYGQFPPKCSSNLRSVIRDSRIWYSLVRTENSIGLIGYSFLRDRLISQVRVSSYWFLSNSLFSEMWPKRNATH